MACYTFAQLEAYARQAGFSPLDAVIMAAIGKAESGGCDVIQQGTSYCGAGADKTGWGIWQITCGDSVPQVGKDFALLDPLKNAQAAFIKFQGSNGFGPWSTFTTGAYRAYLPGGSLYEAGSRNDAGPGNAPAGSVTLGVGGNTGSGAAEGQTPGIGGAIGGTAIISGLVGLPGRALNNIGEGIKGGLLDVGSHLLPWIIILGVGAFALFMIGHELSSGHGGGSQAGMAKAAAESAAA